MKIIITGRHFDVTEELSQYAIKKFSKLEKYFHKLIDMEVVMYLEKHNHIIEAVINADATRFYGTEKAPDMYSSVDLLAKSLEKQAVKHKEKHSGHKVQPLAKTMQTESPENQIEMIFSQAENKPKDETEAFLEMKMDNRDFILFKKCIEYGDNDDMKECYAVIYKSEGGFRMAEIPQDMIKEKEFDAARLLEFDLIVHNDSLRSPRIKLKKCRTKTIKSMAINNAVKEILASGGEFVPFFNNETNSFNVIYKNGDRIEVMVPPV